MTTAETKNSEEIKQIQAELKSKGVKYCIGAYVDIHGVPKGKVVPIDHLEHMAHGSELYTGYALDGLGQQPNDDEIASVPDLDHIIQLPWQPEVAWMLLGAIEADETPRFIHRSVSLDGGDGGAIHFPPYFEPCLMGTDRRLILIARITTDPEIPARTLWTAGLDDPAPRLQIRRGRAVLTGGTWYWDRAIDRPRPPALVIGGSAIDRAFRRGSAFAPLRRFLEGAGAGPASADTEDPEET